ncbi:MAG: hypothetical protein BV458_09940 [Thermoplasmata archaeon M9B2D]|nr:MAG: hypothetical protein BV458_09940 [Thermoplasmata archaeon M9B2D]
MDSISDMYMAAMLLSYGADLLEVDRSDRRRQKFKFGGQIPQIFVRSSEKVVLRIENPSFDDIMTYFVGEKLLFPPSFVDSVRRIKALIHNN